MRLSPGATLGPYEILSPLGAGGMGEVYLAKDIRLGRAVAIKVLPADRLADENRRRRFVQEARAASALNHPHIVTIYEIESAGEIDFIVMEYVPGKTLDALIRPGMRHRDALKIAIPIADALARAHAAGIVHRDLKPTNVAVSDEGVVKVLDFGLAKLVALKEPSGEGDTASAEVPLSRPGDVAGTSGYMSPEQATGGTVDARSDIFAFGAVLYEMVTGRRAFAKGTSAETLAAIVLEEPVVPSKLSRDVPRDLEKVILRCLRKEPEKRFQHMADVKVELEEIRDGWGASPEAAQNRPRHRLRFVVAGAIVGALLLASLWAWRFFGGAAPPPRLRQLTTYRGEELHPALSPDGEQVAFSWEGEGGPEGKRPWRHIWLKLVGGSEIRQLTNGPGDDSFPSWSPDGKEIAFLRTTPLPARPAPWENAVSAGKLEKMEPYRERSSGATTIHLVSPLGGVERKLGDFPAAPYSHLDWTPDGQRIAAARAGIGRQDEPSAGAIHLLPVNGEAPMAVTRPLGGAFHRDPAFSPDRRQLAYLSLLDTSLAPGAYAEIVDLDSDSLPTTSPRRLTPRPMAAGPTGMAWAPDGQSVLYSAGALWRLGLLGTRPPERIELTGAGASYPFVSSRRQRLVFVRWASNADIYAFEPGRPPRPVISSSLDDDEPSYSPDGKRIAFASGRSGENREIWLADADGSNPAQLTRGPGLLLGGPRWSPDGRRLVFDSRGDDLIRDIWVIDVGGGSLRRLTHGPTSQGMGCWSPDGRWIYHKRYHTGGSDIWRIPSEGGAPVRMTYGGGGSKPRVSADGKILYYKERDGDAPLLALPLEGGGPARVVVNCVNDRNLDTGPDGLYYLGCLSDERDLPLYRLDAATGRSQLLGRLETNAPGGLGIAVSPSGGPVLFTRVSLGADLVLVENFR